jgi:UDP-GlcNAc:undecaprenyl-phosphate GlcNAc-1-phosphate transferase
MIELSAYFFLVCLMATGLLVPPAIRLGHRWGVLDHPGPRKVHSDKTPLTGGWAIFAALSLVLWGHLLLGSLFQLNTRTALLRDPLRGFVTGASWLALGVLPLYAGAAATFLLGLADDLLRIPVRTRLFCQVIIAAGLVACGVHPTFGIAPEWVAWVVGVVWIVGITNAFNFLDGLDGLSAGVALTAIVPLWSIALIMNQYAVTVILAAQAGLLLGFLRFNFGPWPAKIFLGSSGSLTIGYLLATSTLRVSYEANFDNWLVPMLTPVFILAVPIYDTTSVVLIRIRDGRHVARGDQSHFHHRLMRLGFTSMQAVGFICLVAFAIGLSAVSLVKATMRESVVALVQIATVLSIIALAERVAARVRRRVLDRKLKRELAKTDTDWITLAQADGPANGNGNNGNGHGAAPDLGKDLEAKTRDR